MTYIQQYGNLLYTSVAFSTYSETDQRTYWGIKADQEIPFFKTYDISPVPIDPLPEPVANDYDPTLNKLSYTTVAFSSYIHIVNQARFMAIRDPEVPVYIADQVLSEINPTHAYNTAAVYGTYGSHLQNLSYTSVAFRSNLIAGPKVDWKGIPDPEIPYQQYPVAIVTPYSQKVSQTQNALVSGSDSYTTANNPAVIIELWEWEWGDDTVNGFGEQAFHSYAELGTYVGTLTVTDSLGQKAKASFTVEVLEFAENRTLYATSEEADLFVTFDNGESWRKYATRSIKQQTMKNVSGRCVESDPINQFMAYFGFNNGTVWKTRDGLGTLDLLYDLGRKVDITSISIDPYTGYKLYFSTEDGYIYEADSDGFTPLKVIGNFGETSKINVIKVGGIGGNKILAGFQEPTGVSLHPGSIFYDEEFPYYQPNTASLSTLKQYKKGSAITSVTDGHGNPVTDGEGNQIVRTTYFNGWYNESDVFDEPPEIDSYVKEPVLDIAFSRYNSRIYFAATSGYVLEYGNTANDESPFGEPTYRTNKYEQVGLNSIDSVLIRHVFLPNGEYARAVGDGGIIAGASSTPHLVKSIRGEISPGTPGFVNAIALPQHSPFGPVPEAQIVKADNSTQNKFWWTYHNGVFRSYEGTYYLGYQTGRHPSSVDVPILITYTQSYYLLTAPSYIRGISQGPTISAYDIPKTFWDPLLPIKIPYNPGNTYFPIYYPYFPIYYPPYLGYDGYPGYFPDGPYYPYLPPLPYPDPGTLYPPDWQPPGTYDPFPDPPYPPPPTWTGGTFPTDINPFMPIGPYGTRCGITDNATFLSQPVNVSQNDIYFQTPSARDFEVGEYVDIQVEKMRVLEVHPGMLIVERGALNTIPYPHYRTEIIRAVIETGDFETGNGVVLNEAITSTQTVIPFIIPGAEGFDVDDYVMGNLEKMRILSISVDDITVVRGVLGTTATSHPLGTILWAITPDSGGDQVVGLKASQDIHADDTDLYFEDVRPFDLGGVYEIDDGHGTIENIFVHSKTEFGPPFFPGQGYISVSRGYNGTVPSFFVKGWFAHPFEYGARSKYKISKLIAGDIRIGTQSGGSFEDSEFHVVSPTSMRCSLIRPTAISGDKVGLQVDVHASQVAIGFFCRIDMPGYEASEEPPQWGLEYAAVNQWYGLFGTMIGFSCDGPNYESGIIRRSQWPGNPKYYPPIGGSLTMGNWAWANGQLQEYSSQFDTTTPTQWAIPDVAGAHIPIRKWFWISAVFDVHAQPFKTDIGEHETRLFEEYEFWDPTIIWKITSIYGDIITSDSNRNGIISLNVVDNPQAILAKAGNFADKEFFTVGNYKNIYDALHFDGWDSRVASSQLDGPQFDKIFIGPHVAVNEYLESLGYGWNIPPDITVWYDGIDIRPGENQLFGPPAITNLKGEWQEPGTELWPWQYGEL